MTASSAIVEKVEKQQKKIFEHLSLEQLPGVAKEILGLTKDKRLYTLEGPLGSGKTTLIKELCKLLGVMELVNSPTFAVAHEYKIASNERQTVYHLDLFRIHSMEEALGIGYEQYIYGDEYCFIEWPSIIETKLPGDRVQINIEQTGKSERTLTILY